MAALLGGQRVLKINVQNELVINRLDVYVGRIHTIFNHALDGVFNHYRIQRLRRW
jgi:hypothetical protein